MGCGAPSGWTACYTGCWPAPAGMPAPSGCCSPWSPRGRSSRLPIWATAAWLSRRTLITGLTDDPAGEPGGVSEDECYRAMDWLIEAAPQVEKEVFWSVASLLDLEVDLLFFDTTSTYFETGDADEAVARDSRGEVLPDDRQQSPGQTEGETETAGEGEGPHRAGFRTW